MNRILEPELMMGAKQARAYAEADFTEAHSRYPKLFQELFPSCPQTGHALDIGCGPGDVTFRFARILPGWSFDAVDGSPAMLAEARKRLGRLASRVHLIEGFIPAAPIPRPKYDLIVSSSLLHHLHRPAVLWNTIRQRTAPGSMVFVVDLRRPRSRTAARCIVESQSDNEPEILRRDFYNSLLAAFTTTEVRRQLLAARLDGLRVRGLAEQHLGVWGRIHHV